MAGSVASTSAASSSAPEFSPIPSKLSLTSIATTLSYAPPPEALQIAPKRRPEAAVVVVARYVEEQPFRGAEKVRVEHGDELTG